MRSPVEAIVELMNELLEMDPIAISTLCHVRVPCNENLAAHPKVQVALLRDPAEAAGDGDEYSVGPIRVLNGLGGADYVGRGAIDDCHRATHPPHRRGENGQRQDADQDAVLRRQAVVVLGLGGGILMKVDLTALMEFDKVPEMNRVYASEESPDYGVLLSSPRGRVRLPSKAGWLSRLWQWVSCNREITQLEATSP